MNEPKESIFPTGFRSKTKDRCGIHHKCSHWCKCTFLSTCIVVDIFLTYMYICIVLSLSVFLVHISLWLARERHAERPFYDSSISKFYLSLSFFPFDETTDFMCTLLRHTQLTYFKYTLLPWLNVWWTFNAVQ